MSTQEAIENILIPEWIEHARLKAADYGEGHQFLGVMGQFSDINRKFQKLKKFMWDEPGSEPEGESLEEILFDLIGHCFLTVDLLRQGGKVSDSDLYKEALLKIRSHVASGSLVRLSEAKIDKILKQVGL